MKVLITASQNKTSAAYDKRFGRAAWFCLFDEQTGETAFIENPHVNASNGAGVKAAEKAVELHVEKIISGDFGPKAKDLLDRFDIQMVILQDDDIPLASVIEQLKK